MVNTTRFSVFLVFFVAFLALCVAPFARAQTVLPPNYDCTFQGYDLSDFSVRDLRYNDPESNFAYFFRLCNVVQDPYCLNDVTASNSTICQRPRGGSGNAYSVAQYNDHDTRSYITSNGLTLVITNGEGCVGNHNAPRVAQIDFVCDETRPTPEDGDMVVGETDTCIYNLTIRTALVCPVDCTYDGLDFTPMRANQLRFDSGSYSYLFRMCGKVNDPACRADPTTRDSMICQKNPNSADTISLANYIGIKNLPWRNTSTGLMFTLYGESAYCAGGFSRRTDVYFDCDGSAPRRGRAARVDEGEQCNYELHINTSLVCTSHYNPAPRCEFLGYNLGVLSTTDLTAFNPNGRASYAHMRMCGIVQNPLCLNDNSAHNSMVCQQMQDHNNTYELAVYNANTLQWTRYPDPSGVNAIQFVQYGEYCGELDIGRETTVIFVCDENVEFTNNVPAKAVSFEEYSTCHYRLVVHTSLVCNDVNQICNFLGYDLTSLSRSDLTYTHPNGREYFFRICGRVSEQRCYDDVTSSSSMLCQITSTDAINLAQYNPVDIRTNRIYNGLFFNITNGEYCESINSYRIAEFRIFCDPYPSATTAHQMIYLDEPETCRYVATILTTAVCPRPPQLDPSFCVFTPAGSTISYNLSPLNNLDLEVVQYSSSGSPEWTVYLRMCGVVQNSLCHHDDTSVNSMICQQNNDYRIDNVNVAEYKNPGEVITSTMNPHGITINLQTGESCGGTPRSVDINVYCDKSRFYSSIAPAVLYSFTEPSTCHYVAEVHTDIVCQGANVVPWVPPTTKSGLSGGAIFGIIVSVLIGVGLLGFLGFKLYQKFQDGTLSTDSIYARSQGLLGEGYRGSTSDHLELNSYQPPKSRVGF